MDDRSNIRRHPEWMHAAEQIIEADFPPGHILTKDWLLEAFSLPPPRQDGLVDPKVEVKFVRNFKRLQRHLLREHKVLLANLWGKGWEMVSPENHSKRTRTLGWSYIKKGLNMWREGFGNAPVHLMDDAARKEHAQMALTAANIQADLNKRRKQWALPTPEGQRVISHGAKQS